MSCHRKCNTTCKKKNKICNYCCKKFDFIVPPRVIPVVSSALKWKKNTPCPCAKCWQENFVDNANDILTLDTSPCTIPLDTDVDENILDRKCLFKPVLKNACRRKVRFGSPISNVESSTYCSNAYALNYDSDHFCQDVFKPCHCGSSKTKECRRHQTRVDKSSLKQNKTVECRSFNHTPSYVSSDQSESNGTADYDPNAHIHDNSKADIIINADTISKYSLYTGDKCVKTFNNQLHNVHVSEKPLSKSNSYHYCSPKDSVHFNKNYDATRDMDCSPHGKCKVHEYENIGSNMSRNDKQTICNLHNNKINASTTCLDKKSSDCRLEYDLYIPSAHTNMKSKSSCAVIRTPPHTIYHNEESIYRKCNKPNEHSIEDMLSGTLRSHKLFYNKQGNKDVCRCSPLQCKCCRYQNSEKNITMSDFLHDLNNLPNELLSSISPCGNKQDELPTSDNCSINGPNLEYLKYCNCNETSSNTSLSTCSKYIDKQKVLGKDLVNVNKNISDVTIPTKETHSVNISIKSIKPIKYSNCDNSGANVSNNNFPNKISNSTQSLTRLSPQTDPISSDIQGDTTENFNTNNASNLNEHEKSDINFGPIIEKALLNISSQLANIEKTMQSISRKKHITLQESKSANTIISSSCYKKNKKYNRLECSENCKYKSNSIPIEFPEKLESSRKHESQPKLPSGTYIPPLFSGKKFNMNLLPVLESNSIKKYFRRKTRDAQESPGKESLKKNVVQDSNPNDVEKVAYQTINSNFPQFNDVNTLKGSTKSDVNSKMSSIELFESVNAEKLGVIYNVPLPDFKE